MEALTAEHDRALEEINAALAASGAETREAWQKAEAAERRASYCDQRLEGLRDQRDMVAASTLALLARVAAAGDGAHARADLYLQSNGGRRSAVYALADGTLALSPLTGRSTQGLCLITLPKAGTYLMGAFLKALGLVDTGVHVDRFGFSDYRHKSIDEMRADYLKFTTHIPIEVSAGLTAAGQFIVGHLEHSAQTVEATAKLRRILLIRHPRDALVSFMRFFELPGRAKSEPKTWMATADGPDRLLAFLEQWGARLLGLMQGVTGWLNEPEVLVVRFEALMGDAGCAAQRRTLEAVAQHAGVPSPPDPLALFLQDVVGKPTKTWSGARSEVARYWDGQVEAQFIRLGGDAMQRALGYSADGLVPHYETA